MKDYSKSLSGKEAHRFFLRQKLSRLRESISNIFAGILLMFGITMILLTWIALEIK